MFIKPFRIEDIQIIMGGPVMIKRCKGFKLTEFVVVVAILAIIASLAFPAFVKSRDKAREREVKSNIFIIQMALARYCVDTGGHYPPFLIGAEAEYNIIQAHIDPGYKNAAKIRSGVTPFAKRWDESLAGQEYCAFTMDPLIYYGYMSGYPRNPFAKRDSNIFCASPPDGPDKSGTFPYAGLHGDRMFDLGFGYGDTPQTDFVLSEEEILQEEDDNGKTILALPDLDAPGNFYYHPIFADLQPVYLHYVALYNAVYGNGDPDEIIKIYGSGVSYQDFYNRSQVEGLSYEVIGYYLYAYGSGRKGHRVIQQGYDIFNTMPDSASGDLGKFGKIAEWLKDVPDFGSSNFLDSTVNTEMQQRRVETTGYPSSEYDPWTAAYPDGINPRDLTVKYLKSGSDGILDWIIMEDMPDDKNVGPAVKTEYLNEWRPNWAENEYQDGNQRFYYKDNG